MRTTNNDRASATPRPRATAVLLAVWGLFIAYGTLIPFDFSATPSQAAEKLLAAVNRTEPPGRLDAIANVLLFLPWGVLWGVWTEQRGLGWVLACLTAAMSGLALSATVEAAQLFAPSRVSSHYDLVTNTVGSVLGSSVGWPFGRRVWPSVAPRIRTEISTRPLTVATLAALLAIAFTALAPFDLTLDLGEMKQAVKQARILPFGPRWDGSPGAFEPWSWGSDLLVWALIGGLAALAAREAGRSGLTVIPSLAITAAFVSLGIEIAQILISSRETDMTSPALAALGAAIGASLVVFNPAIKARGWIKPAWVLWLIGIVISAWTPLNLRPAGTLPEITLIQLIPFWAYYQRTGILALADLLTQVLAYVPLGMMIAVGWRRPRPLAVAAALGFGIALVLEAGQLFLVDRTAEITDALSSAMGAGLGAWLWGWGKRSLNTRAAGSHARYVDGRQLG